MCIRDSSTTAKIAVIDSDNRVIYSKYERHNARVNELVSQYFDEILALTGDAEARICVTGSVGMATAEQLQAEFVQEVVAASVYARTAHPCLLYTSLFKFTFLRKYPYGHDKQEKHHNSPSHILYF